MVSGFFTSPWDQERIISGAAIEIRTASNDNGSLGLSKKFNKSFKARLPFAFG
jgi:hypothetical protein